MKRFLLLATLAFSSTVVHAQGNSCPVDTCWLILRVESNDAYTPFQFEGTCVTRGLNKKSSFQVISGKAPFELK